MRKVIGNAGKHDWRHLACTSADAKNCAGKNTGQGLRNDYADYCLQFGRAKGIARFAQFTRDYS